MVALPYSGLVRAAYKSGTRRRGKLTTTAKQTNKKKTVHNTIARTTGD